MAVENSPIVRNSFLLLHKFLLRPRTSQKKKFSSPQWARDEAFGCPQIP
jgi:hypothetical protein